VDGGEMRTQMQINLQIKTDKQIKIKKTTKNPQNLNTKLSYKEENETRKAQRTEYD